MKVNLLVSKDARSFIRECLQDTKHPHKTLCVIRAEEDKTDPVCWSIGLLPTDDVMAQISNFQAANVDCFVEFDEFRIPTHAPELIHELEGKILAYGGGYMHAQEINEGT